MITAHPAPVVKRPTNVGLQFVAGSLPTNVLEAEAKLTPIQHLRKAAEHLEAAGEWNGIDIGKSTAADLRETADALEQEAAKRLEELTEQLRVIQEEIDKLRKLTGTLDQIHISCAVIEVTADHVPPQFRSGSAGEHALAEAIVQSTITISGDQDIDEMINPLVRAGNAKILARPSIVTRDGRPASLLSGGEFPVLVPQASGRVSIEWREFGVRFEAIPRMLGNGRVRLDVNPEISERDYTNATTVEGMVVPGIKTRRLNTQVEMQLGQTLIIGGLSHRSSPQPPTSVSTPVETRSGESPIQQTSAEIREEDEKVLLILIKPETVSSHPGSESIRQSHQRATPIKGATERR